LTTIVLYYPLDDGECKIQFLLIFYILLYLTTNIIGFIFQHNSFARIPMPK